METREDRLAAWVDSAFESRAAAARACGLVPQSMNEYLKGKSRPGADILERMARAGLDVSWYLTGERSLQRIGEPSGVYDPLQMSEALLSAEILDPREALPQLKQLHDMQGHILDRLLEAVGRG